MKDDQEQQDLDYWSTQTKIKTVMLDFSLFNPKHFNDFEHEV
jgi:hypothetical protein